MRRVLIIGGGIGGLSASIALHKSGHDVEVLELNPSPKVYHVGIIVQGNFLGALDRIGVADAAVAVGYPYETLHNFHADGSPFYEQVPIRMTEKFSPFLGITRPALHDVLMDEVTRLGITVTYGETAERFDEDDEGVVVTMRSGRSGRYDMVIGADGAYSKTRAYVAPGQTNAFTGQGVWRYNIPRTADVTGLRVFMGKQDMTCGLVPLNEETMYIFLVSKEAGNPFFAEHTLADEFRARLDGYGGPIPAVRDQITDPSLVVYRPLEGVLVPAPWNRGRVVLLGDAAHATTPHMGQGAALAVEDAVVLAEEFDKDQPIAQVMANYNARRFERCRLVLETSRAIGEHEMDRSNGFDIQKAFKEVFTALAQPL